ncbi:hypothetical protein GY26_02005 [Gammaproteobacteria bacterium MFB021]|nr:hypothetical protein GY26_02005 [Gammaproteobacteria bacterium MFB021]
MIMTYEAWRVSFQDAEQAARAAFRLAQEQAAKITRAQALADEQLVDHSSHTDETGTPCQAVLAGRMTWQQPWARALHNALNGANGGAA